MTHNILISSAGRRVELLECFRKSMAKLDMDGKVLAADVAPQWSPACHVADQSFAVPRCYDQTFIPEMIRICNENHVTLIIPTIDTELLVYANNETLLKNNGIRVLLSSGEFVGMARNKIETMRYFASLGIGTPKTWVSRDEKSQFEFPLIAKPTDGSCSAGLVVLQNEKELDSLRYDQYQYMFQEKCVGDEYTVNAYYEDGCFRCAVPHRRVKTRSGEVLFGETCRIPALEKAAETLAKGEHSIEGCLCFQAFCREDALEIEQCQVIEINARFGGGYPLCDHAGGNFAKWIIQKHMTGSSDANNVEWKNGVRMLRYDAAVFYNVTDVQDENRNG